MARLRTNTMTDERRDVTKTEKTEKNTGLPIDRGWAWVILAAATLQLFILGGMLKTGGIFFVELQKRFQSSSSMTSLISSIQTGIYSLASLFMMTLGMQFFDCRKVVMTGSVMMSVGFIITAFAEDIYILFFSLGLLMGAGAAFVFAPTFVMIGTYFNKRRGLANSISVSGSSLGWLVFSQILTFLFEHYGFTGTYLISAGVLFNSFIAGALYRPLTFYANRKTRKSISNAHETHKPLLEDCETEAVGTNGVTRASHQIKISPNSSLSTKDKPLQFQRTISHQPAADMYPPRTVPGDLIADEYRGRSQSVGNRRLRSGTVSSVHSQFSITNILTAISHSDMAMLSGAEGLCSSALELRASTQRVDGSSKAGDTYKDSAEEQTCIRKTRTLLSKSFDCGLWRNPIFVLLVTWQAVVICGLGLIPVYLAPFARDVGVDEEDIGLLFTIVGIIDLFGRLITGVIADSKYVDRSIMVAISAAIVGIALQFVRFCTDFVSIVIVSAIYGVFGGVFFSLFAVIIVDLLGLEKLQTSLGFSVVMNGVVIAAGFQAVGAIRDNTGTYVIPFHIMGILLIVGSAVCVGTSRLHKWQVQRTGKAVELDPLDKTLT